MSNISSIKLPDGITYPIIDVTSGYGFGTITSVALNGTTIATGGDVDIQISTAAISINTSTHTLNITTNVSSGDEANY